MNNLISCPCTLQAGCQCNTLKLNLHLNGAWDCDNHNLPDKILLIPRRRRERHGRDDDGRHGKTEERVRRQQDLVGLQALLSGEGDVDAAAKARFSTRQRFSIPFGLCFLFQRSLKSALGPCSLPCLSNSQIRVISISNRPPNSINSAFKFKSNTKFSIRQRFSNLNSGLCLLFQVQRSLKIGESFRRGTSPLNSSQSINRRWQICGSPRPPSLQTGARGARQMVKGRQGVL